MRQHGFSLVELSIVLVILGLLTGGILAGQSLIHAAELRAINTEFQRYNSAFYAFRDKFNAIPGDMSNAVTFWNRQVNQAWCLPTSGATVSTPGTCNGDGNGTMAPAPAANQSGENFQFWRQLALAGLIEGDYTGYAGPGNGSDLDTGINGPASKSAGTAVWGVRNLATTYMFSNWVTANVMTLGATHATNHDADHNLITASDMWNIDTKLDDGKPAYGFVQAYNFTYRPNCVTSDTPSTATYQLTLSSIGCNLVFRFP